MEYQLTDKTDLKIKACNKVTRQDGIEEMDINYLIIQRKVEELNELGVDITLQEIGDIIETKFAGKPVTATLRLKKDGKLLYPEYTLIKELLHSI